MTEEQPEYIPFSHPPFEGDHFIWEEIKKLVKQYGIKTIVETGTQSGATTASFAAVVPNVITVEHDELWYNAVAPALIALKVVAIRADSPPILVGLDDWNTFPILVYLDAHDSNTSPIRQELLMISGWDKPPIVVVHDVKVPDKDFGYDTYSDGTELTYDYFKDSIKWPHTYYYNHEAQGARRGVIYIIPKEHNDTKREMDYVGESLPPK